MAARLCSKAAAGQVLVTTQLAEAAGAPEQVVFESRGAVELKGFDRPVELLEAQHHAGGGRSAPAGRCAGGAPT